MKESGRSTKIVMDLVIFRWLCLRGFYGVLRILMTYLCPFSQPASFNPHTIDVMALLVVGEGLR